VNSFFKDVAIIRVYKNISIRKRDDIMMPKKENPKTEKLGPDEVDLDLIRVECICPKCGNRHLMNFPWTGRGMPRKFCPRCKIG
jgi:hypothetical protein